MVWIPYPESILAYNGTLELNMPLEEIRRNILNYKGIKKRFDIIPNIGIV